MRTIPVAGAQATYYALSGAFPLVAYRAFEAITGRKREPWLVKTIGVLLLPVAHALMADPAGTGSVTRRLGVGSALGFAAIDVWYAGVRRRISPVYLADALAEAAILALWWHATRRDGPAR